MNRMKQLCGFLSSNIAVLIIIFSFAAFFYPGGFSWATNYTTVFLGLAMFGMGLTIKSEDFRIVFTRPKDLLIGCLLQFTLMPLAAFALAKLFHLPTDLALGVILVGCCPGGTASNVITYVAGGDVPLSVGMTIVSTILAPVCTPVLVYALAGSWVEVSLYTMMLSVVKVVLLPVLGGILIYRIFPKQVDRCRDFLPLISVAAIVMIISGIVGSNAEKIVTCGALVMIVVAIHNGVGLLLGTLAAKWLKLEDKKVTAIGIEVGMQNSGLAISLAAANFAANPLATLPGAIFSVWHNISGTLYAGIRNRKKREHVNNASSAPAAEQYLPLPQNNNNITCMTKGEFMGAKKFSTKQFVELALLVAVIVLLAFTPIGYIRTFGLEITLIVGSRYPGTRGGSGFGRSIWNYKFYPVFWHESVRRRFARDQSCGNVCCLRNLTCSDGLADRCGISGTFQYAVSSQSGGCCCKSDRSAVKYILLYGVVSAFLLSH